jgi:hypothetical protein
MMDTLRWLFGFMGSETVKDYISVTDEETPFMDYEGRTPPKTFRIKEMADNFPGSGSPSGKVAHMAINFEVSKRGYELDLEPTDATCNYQAFEDLLDQLHGSLQISLFRVQKTMHDITSCIHEGRPVAIALPVTEDVFDKSFVMPHDGNVFGFVPVVLWAYSKTADMFIAHVPLDAYDTHIKIPSKHVLCEDACDLYSVVISDSSEDEPLFIE